MVEVDASGKKNVKLSFSLYATRFRLLSFSDICRFIEMISLVPNNFNHVAIGRISCISPSADILPAIRMKHIPDTPVAGSSSHGRYFSLFYNSHRSCHAQS